MSAREERTRHAVRRLLAQPGLWLLTAIVAGLALGAPGFLTGGNLASIGRTAAILGLAACAQAIVIVTGGLDLSAGSAVALMSVVTVSVAGLGTVPAFGVGALVVIGAGALNGLLVARFEIPPFLVTLGTLTALHGLASMLAGGSPVEADGGGAFSWPSGGEVLGLPVPVLIALAAFAVFAVLLRGTLRGRSWLLVGSSYEAARAAGLHVRRTLFGAYVTAGAFLALAGVILTSRVHSGQPDLDATLPFEAIAACAIGGVPLTGGAASAGGLLTGVLVVAVTGNGLLLLNLPSDVQITTIGVLTIGAVLAQRRPARLRRRRRADATGDQAAPISRETNGVTA